MSIQRITEKELAMALDAELLEQEIHRLKEVIEDHNRGCRVSCAAMRVTGHCKGFVERGRNCPTCPLDWLIEEGKQ